MSLHRINADAIRDRSTPHASSWTVAATCPTCGRSHEISPETAAEFTRLCQCIPCIDRAHVEFMRTTGARLGLKD